MSPNSLNGTTLKLRVTRRHPQDVLLIRSSVTAHARRGHVLRSTNCRIIATISKISKFGGLRSQTFSTIVSSVRVPGLSNLRLARHVQRRQRCGRLPIMLMAALTDSSSHHHKTRTKTGTCVAGNDFGRRILLRALRQLV